MSQSSKVTVFAPAKLNLFLHVIGKRADGFHELQSLFVFLSIGDRLTFQDAAAFDLEMYPDLGVPRAANLAWKALDGVRAICPDLPPTLVTIEKSLPAEAGLGGGTADAPAVVHWAESQRAGVDFRRPLAGLGADMPPAMDQQARLWTGTGGEAGSLVPGLRGTPVLLLKPDSGVSTGACFAALRGNFGAPVEFDMVSDPWPQIERARNDLEDPARALNPDIDEALNRLKALPGVHFVRMTGSGSTCFAVFKEKGLRDAALVRLRSSKATWWSAAAEIL